jgi:ABC-type polysaccharide/polyol phosphate export permease
MRVKVSEMNHIGNILLHELTPDGKRTPILVIINILTTLLLYLVLIVGMGNMLPRIQFVDIRQWMFPGAVGFFTLIFAFNLPLHEAYTMTNHTGLIDQVYSSPLLTGHVFMVKSVVYLLKSSAHLLLSSVVLLIIARPALHFGYLLLFWLYMIFSFIALNQLGIITGICSANLKIRTGMVILFFTTLVLGSGILIPADQYPGMWKALIGYFPLTAIIEGAREIVLYGTFDQISGLIVLFLNVLAIVISYFLFKRKISG